MPTLRFHQFHQNMRFHQTSFGLYNLSIICRPITADDISLIFISPAAQMNKKMAQDHSMPRKCPVPLHSRAPSPLCYMGAFDRSGHLCELQYGQDVTASSTSTKSQNLSWRIAHNDCARAAWTDEAPSTLTELLPPVFMLPWHSSTNWRNT